MQQLPEHETERIRHNEEKWTSQLWAAGWTGLPSVILVYQKQLGLDPVDVNILLQIAKHWWFADNLPRPSKRSLAEAIGRDPRTVQRHIAALEKRGYIQRVRRSNAHGGQGANEYSFVGLIREATPYAEELIASRAARRQEDRQRRRRRGLKVIPGGSSRP